VAITSGTVEVVMKPCPSFGVANGIWLFSYQEEACGSTPNIRNNCSAAYTKQCCIDGNCTINPNGKTGDVCRGQWIKNKEIDIELPSSVVNGDKANDPAYISFGNLRANSVQAVPWSYKHHTKCGINDHTNPDGTSSCEDDNYVAVNPATSQNDGKFHTYKIDWDGESTVKVYVDGTLQKTITKYVPSVDLAAGELPLNLNIASWFPNSWAGSPEFSTCVTEVASVMISGVAASASK
jgi:beta-glucanase (GH16 family)